MPNKPIELSPEVARRFDEDMRAFFAEGEPDQARRDRRTTGLAARSTAWPTRERAARDGCERDVPPDEG